MLIDKNFIYFESDKIIAEKLSATWNQKRKMWKIPRNLWAIRELYKVFPNDNLKNLGKRLVLAHEQFQELKKKDKTDPFLRPYQRGSVEYLKQIPHGGLFLEQRLGKSPVSLVLFEEEGRKKNLIVCPASLVLMWANEVEKWTDKKPFPVTGTKKQREKTYQDFNESESGYLIISKDTLKRDVDIIEAM